MQEHLGETSAGIYQTGKRVHPDLANNIRTRIHDRVYHDSTPTPTGRIRDYCPFQCRYRYKSRPNGIPEKISEDLDGARSRYAIGQGCFIGSAIMSNNGRQSVLPCLVDIRQDPCCLVSHKQKVLKHSGKYVQDGPVQTHPTKPQLPLKIIDQVYDFGNHGRHEVGISTRGYCTEGMDTRRRWL